MNMQKYPIVLTKVGSTKYNIYQGYMIGNERN